MSDTTQETHAKANSSNVMTYNAINDALGITTLTMKKGNIRTVFAFICKMERQEFLFMFRLQNCVTTDPQHQQARTGAKN